MPAVATDELLDLLSEAAVEIANLDSPANVVCRRLRTMQKRLESLTTTIGELAHRVDIAPRDLLDAARAAGVYIYWHEGQQFRTPAQLQCYLGIQHHFDPLPELEVDLTREQVERLAAELGVEVQELNPEAAGGTPSAASGSMEALADKPLRKFAASDPALADRRAAGESKQANYLSGLLRYSHSQTKNSRSLEIGPLLREEAIHVLRPCVFFFPAKWPGGQE